MENCFLVDIEFDVIYVKFRQVYKLANGNEHTICRSRKEETIW